MKSRSSEGRLLILVGGRASEVSRHRAVADALVHLCSSRGWEVYVSQDAGTLEDATLSRYDVVALLNVGPSEVTATQQAAHERFRQRGGGTVVIHPGERAFPGDSWRWYRDRLPTITDGEPIVQEITVVNFEASHPSMAKWPFVRRLRGQWHRIAALPREGVHSLLFAYDPLFYPYESPSLAWYEESREGRYFYTRIGALLEERGVDRLLEEHVVAGIEWAARLRPTHVKRSSAGEALILSEFDSTCPTGVWRRQAPSPEFTYSVTPTELRMHDSSAISHANRHLVREGVSIDPKRPYAIEGKVTIPGPLDPSKHHTFCCNLNVAGADGSEENVETWSVPIHVLAKNRSVTRIMGFCKGAFFQIGQFNNSWGDVDREYSFRIYVNADLQGLPQDKLVSVCIKTEGETVQEVQIDHSSFPYQPDPSRPVRFGVNSHGSGWVLRQLRIYYLDVFDEGE